MELGRIEEIRDSGTMVCFVGLVSLLGSGGGNWIDLAFSKLPSPVVLNPAFDDDTKAYVVKYFLSPDDAFDWYAERAGAVRCSTLWEWLKRNAPEKAAALAESGCLETIGRPRTTTEAVKRKGDLRELLELDCDKSCAVSDFCCGATAVARR